MCICHQTSNPDITHDIVRNSVLHICGPNFTLMEIMMPIFVVSLGGNKHNRVGTLVISLEGRDNASQSLNN